jgi:hypothetical protein
MLNDEMSFYLLFYEICDGDTPNTLSFDFFKRDGKFHFEGALPCQGGNSIDASRFLERKQQGGTAPFASCLDCQLIPLTFTPESRGGKREFFFSLRPDLKRKEDECPFKDIIF